MLNVVLLLVVAGCIVALRNWRWGIGVAVLAGLLQDPLRKMIPGAPAYLVMASAPIWVATVASAAFAGQMSPHRFFSCFPRLGVWIQAFALYLLIPAVISGTYGPNTWKIALLGAFVYLTTFFVMVAGWRYPDRKGGIERFMVFYAAAAALMLIGGPLESWGLQDRFPFIGTNALGHIWVTYRMGAPVHMLSGFFRGPDVMGWHASLMCMVALILAFRARGASRWAWIAVAVWGVLNIWLCGRRKMLSMLPIFMGCYFLLVFRFKNAKRTLSIAGLALMVGGLGWYFISSLYPNAAVEQFYLSTLSDVEERVETHGYRSVIATVVQAGFWGYGMGMSQQGVHNIEAETPRLWQESGPSKVVAELGVPGTLLFLGLGLVLFVTAYHVVRFGQGDSAFYFTSGILSILAANVASAVVSAQIFGDPLVSFLLAFLAGLLFSDVRNPTVAPTLDAGPQSDVPEGHSCDSSG